MHRNGQISNAEKPSAEEQSLDFGGGDFCGLCRIEIGSEAIAGFYFADFCTGREMVKVIRIERA